MPGYFAGYIGTQVDKSMDAIETYIHLFKNLPLKDNRLDYIKSGLIQSINTRKPSWRSRGIYVSNQIKQGHSEDPNKFDYDVYNKVEFQDIVDFHKNNIKKDPLIITIVTDRSKINIDNILDYGELIELKKEKVFN